MYCLRCGYWPSTGLGLWVFPLVSMLESLLWVWRVVPQSKHTPLLSSPLLCFHLSASDLGDEISSWLGFQLPSCTQSPSLDLSVWFWTGVVPDRLECFAVCNESERVAVEAEVFTTTHNDQCLLFGLWVTSFYITKCTIGVCYGAHLPFFVLLVENGKLGWHPSQGLSLHLGRGITWLCCWSGYL